MTSLAVILASIALLHSSTATKLDDLTLFVTDEINDAIRDYNRNGVKAPFPLKDIETRKIATDAEIYAKATGGTASIKRVKLDAEYANVTFTTEEREGERVHILRAIYPITLRGLELQYAHVDVDVKVGNSGVLLEEKEAKVHTQLKRLKQSLVKAFVGQNRFFISTEVLHVYGLLGAGPICRQTTRVAAVTQFKVTHVAVTNASDLKEDLVEALVKGFQAELLKAANAVHILENVINRGSISYIPKDCKEVHPLC